MKTKKKIVALLAGVLAIALPLVACGSSDKGSSTGNEPTKNEIKEEKPKGDFPDIAGTLKELGLEYEETAVAPEMIGAAKGKKFIVGEGSVEYYVFDKKSEAYKTAEADQQLTIEEMGMSFPAYVANGKALVVTNVDKSDEIVEKLKP